LGADGVAVSNSAMQSIGCVAARMCNTNNCPAGIATQKVTTHPIKKHKKLDGILRQIMWRCQARVNVRVKNSSAAL
jgi:glutamate synthase domain-containing protein 2